MTRQFGNRAVWQRLAALAVSGVVLALVLRRIEPAALVEAWRRMKPGWFLAAHFLFVLASASVALRWHLTLRTAKVVVHGGATFRLALIGHFFNTLLFGPAGGDFAKTAVYSRWFGHGMPAVYSACVLDRLLGGCGFLIFSVTAPAVALLAGAPMPASRQLALPGPWPWIAGGLAAVLLLVASLRWRPAGTAPLLRFVDAFKANMRQLLATPGVALKGALLSFAAHGFINLILLFCLQAVAGKPFSLLQLVWTLPVISVLTAVPLTFAGAGVREGAALALLGLQGVSETDAVAAALLSLLVYLVWAGIGGGVLWRTSVALVRSARKPGTLASGGNPALTLSAVMPTLNEAGSIEETVRRLRAIPEIIEIIVADGGSTDDTRARAESLGCCVLACARGRGTQLRAGALAARGDVILMVHADTWLPPHAGQAVLDCLRDPGVVAGGFWKRFREPRWLMRGSRFRCALRLYLARRIAGDQCLFVRKPALEAVGGVPDVALMEEFELCCRLARIGRLALAGATVSTSTRRFVKLGVLRTYWRMWLVTLRYRLGASSQALHQLYEKD